MLNLSIFLNNRISSLVTLVVIVNNSAVTETRGTVNGLGQSLLAIFRAFTPALGSIAFAWSEKAGNNNYHVSLFLSSLLLFYGRVRLSTELSFDL